MFFETYRGFVGLGATEVFRTAEQAAADLEFVSKDTATMVQYGGLLNQQTAFKYAASQGRLRDVQQEVEKIATQIMPPLESQLNNIINELEGLGVARAGDYIKMAAKTVVGFFIPGVGLLSMFGVDVFGGSGKKKKITKLAEKATALVQQLQYWNGRRDALQTEGEGLAKAMEKGAGEISVQLVAQPRIEKIVAREADPEKYGKNRVWREKKDIDVKDMAYGREMLATQEELATRVPGKMAPSGDRLPVGFQTIYSPILEHGKMIVKNQPLQMATPYTQTRPKAVYGGLVSGVGDLPAAEENKDFLCFVGWAIAAAAIVIGLSTTKR